VFFPVAYGRAHGCGHDAATSQFSEHATTPPPHEGFLPQKNIVHYREVLVKEIIKAFRINESVLEAFRKLSSIIVLMNVSRSSERVPNSHIHGLQGTTNEIGEIERPNGLKHYQHGSITALQHYRCFSKILWRKDRKGSHFTAVHQTTWPTSQPKISRT